MEALPRTTSPPSLYLEAPAFDIELEEFGRLPLRRLDAIRLLREGPTTDTESFPPDAGLLLLHGHGNRPSEAKHRRADLASHFILRLACCGGNRSSINAAVGDDGQLNPLSSEESKSRDRERREQEAGWQRGRRDWFVRAERDLFKARLHWHLGQTGGRGAREKIEAPSARTAGSAAGAEHDERASRASRLDALRVVYDLGWLHPVEPTRAGHDGVEDMPGRAYGSGKGSGGGSRRGGKGSGSGGGAAAADNSSGAAGKRRRDGDEPFREEGPAPFPAGATTTNGGGMTTTGAKTNFGGADAAPPPLSAGANSDGRGAHYLSCPFEKVLPLVRSRQVLLRDGLALLSPVQVPEAVTEHFERRLREALAVAERGLPGVEADERIRGALGQVRSAVDVLACGGGSGGGVNDNRSSAVITRSNIDQVAAKHFPLCMRRTLKILRREHHLKYQARLQFVSFLGNAGMEVGELLGLWREEFPKGMPAAEYARKRNQYEYSLRHLYGLEGKRRAYSSQSCARIASLGWGGTGEGGSGQGCPFLSHPRVPGGSGPNGTGVRNMLAEQDLSAVDIEDIVGPLESRGGSAAGRGGGGGGGAGSCGGESAGGGAVGACQRHFSATHRWGVGGGSLWRTGGTGGQEASPNGWLAASTRSVQPQEQGQEQRAAAPADEGEFLTQQGQGV